MGSISVVINTLNEETNLPRAIASVSSLADEIIVCDMQSSDSTVEVAEKLGAVVFEHKSVGYVEPARNFAVAKASKDWILILDADEEISPSLAKKLKEIVKKPDGDYYRLPRKNLVFGKWLKYSRWWPDYNIRFFKKGKVIWNEVIHSVPLTTGKGIDLLDKEELAIVHHHYTSVEQYLERMNRYTSVQAEAISNDKYKFIWKDIVHKPLSEFLSRYFSGEGYKDGLHGLSVAFLQAFSELILYLKIWQKEKFLAQTISVDEISYEFKKAGKEADWWLTSALLKSKGFIFSFPLRIRRFFLRKKIETVK